MQTSHTMGRGLLSCCALCLCAVADECEPYWAEGNFVHSGLVGEVVHALAEFDDGSGNALYAAGHLLYAGGANVNNVAKWNGFEWQPVGAGMNGFIAALVVFDDGTGTALYAGGAFTQAGGVQAHRVAKWDGNEWSPVGAGFDDGTVFALHVHDDGNGPALYAGGGFAHSNGTSVTRIARWDGSDWLPVGDGFVPDEEFAGVEALASVDFGAGDVLFAAGSSFHGYYEPHLYGWNGQEWSEVPTKMTKSNGSPRIRVLARNFDGQQPALYIGGEFDTIDELSSKNVARWDGEAWSSVGAGGLNGPRVRALRWLEINDEVRLFAGGWLLQTPQGSSAIVQWDGSAWSKTADLYHGPSTVRTFMAWQGSTDTSRALYAGAATWNEAGQGTQVSRWDGGEWEGLYNPIDTALNGGGAHASVVFDDGTGAALYVAGQFTHAGDVEVNRIARWDGENWAALGEGADGIVQDMTVFDDGSGPALYVAGNFINAGGKTVNRIAKWDGKEWHDLNSGANHNVLALIVHEDQEGSHLYAGGRFTEIGGVAANKIAKWNGTEWTAVGTELGTDPSHYVNALAVVPGGFVPGAILVAGGDLPAQSNVAMLFGTNWLPLSGHMPSGWVFSLTFWDDGTGPALYVAGSFSSIGGTTMSGLARFKDWAWSPIENTPSGSKYHVSVLDDGVGGGPSLIVGLPSISFPPETRGLMKWDGESWDRVAGGLSGPVWSTTIYDDGTGTGPALFAVGNFITAGNVNAGRAAKLVLCPTSTVTGDLNGDGIVDVEDLLILLAAWGPCADPVKCPADLDGNGTVGVSDLLILLANWG